MYKILDYIYLLNFLFASSIVLNELLLLFCPQNYKSELLHWPHAKNINIYTLCLKPNLL